MIELPRAALRADQIAEHAAFFSFGTNDLTQMALGLSRDDPGKFLEAYIRAYIRRPVPDPRPGRRRRAGRDRRRAQGRRGPTSSSASAASTAATPASVAFCERVGLDYVSCSPYRVPIARLAAAQAALRSEPA